MRLALLLKTFVFLYVWSHRTPTLLAAITLLKVAIGYIQINSASFSVTGHYAHFDEISLLNFFSSTRGENDRGVSYTFGPDIVAKFLHKHDLDLICRAHQVGSLKICENCPFNWSLNGYTELQVVEDGYEFFAKRQLVTLFSAPNYCGEFDNAGAMMSVDESLMCSFQVRSFAVLDLNSFRSFQTFESIH